MKARNLVAHGAIFFSSLKFLVPPCGNQSRENFNPGVRVRKIPLQLQSRQLEKIENSDLVSGT